MSKENYISSAQESREWEILTGLNLKVLKDSGIMSLLKGLKNAAVFRPNFKKEDQTIISSLKMKEYCESAVLIYMWPNMEEKIEQDSKSLTLVASVKDQKTIHLFFREVAADGEEKVKSSVFDISKHDQKKEMLEEVALRFTQSLIPHKKTQE